jgi:hypothetical protein
MGKKPSRYYLKLHPEIVEVERFYEKYFTHRRCGIGVMRGSIWGHFQDGYYVQHPDKTIGFYYEREFTPISEEEFQKELGLQAE